MQPEWIVNILFGVIMALFGVLTQRLHKKVDQSEDRISDIERGFVPTSTCDKINGQLRGDIKDITKRLEDSLAEHRQETRDGFKDLVGRIDKLADARRG